MSFVIGIDPGKDTGFAVFDTRTQHLVSVETVTFWRAYELVRNIHQTNAGTLVVIEVPQTKHVWQKATQNKVAMQRQAVNVGEVIREATLLADGIEQLGVRVKRVHPRGKVDADRFKRFTGWLKRTNQHERDAALLCFRRKPTTE